MKLAIAFEGGVLGGLVVGDMHVARKGKARPPAARSALKRAMRSPMTSNAANWSRSRL
jgi:hypothetical protein